MKRFMFELLMVFSLVALALGSTTFLNGEDEKKICNMPYTVHEDSCCLDVNHNQICDRDEDIARHVLGSESEQLRIPKRL